MKFTIEYIKNPLTAQTHANDRKCSWNKPGTESSDLYIRPLWLAKGRGLYILPVFNCAYSRHSLPSSFNLPSSLPMSRPSRQQPPQMPPPEALMGPPPLPPQMAYPPPQVSANSSMPGGTPKQSHSQDVGEKYSKLKRKYFELEEVRCSLFKWL